DADASITKGKLVMALVNTDVTEIADLVDESGSASSKTIYSRRDEALIRANKRHELTFAFVPDRYATSTEEMTFKLGDFYDVLSKVVPNEAGLPLPEFESAPREIQGEQKDGPAIIPAIFIGDRRRIRENVAAQTMIVIDSDDGKLSLAEASSRL